MQQIIKYALCIGIGATIGGLIGYSAQCSGSA